MQHTHTHTHTHTRLTFVCDISFFTDMTRTVGHSGHYLLTRLMVIKFHTMYTLMSKQRARFCPLQCLQTNTLNIAFIQPPYKSAQLEYVTYMNSIGIYVNCHIQTLCLPSWATLPGPNTCIVCSTLS